ncbi:MAG: hypothetical protein V7L11_12250 [Nostoc sp.]|uniref:hypothetical protein n=1 Tax=Nostoc sp. TaxID=1180 RepID=UPI002FF85574
MTIVSNTSPISNLAKVGQINLLQQLYETVLIPTAVYEELLDERAGEDVITAVQSAIWLKIQVVENQELVSELRNLINLGEAEAIALAIEVNAARLLRVLQVKKCPVVIASVAKQSQPLRLLRNACNDGFWIIYFVEFSNR